MGISEAKEESHESGIKCNSMVGNEQLRFYPNFRTRTWIHNAWKKERFNFIEISHCESKLFE